LQREIFSSFDVTFPNVDSTIPRSTNDSGEVVGIYGTSTAAGQEFSFLAIPSN
jgi:hypothetical protein